MEQSQLLITDRKSVSAAGAQTVGWKADGICKLPEAWVPKFFIITAAAHCLWRKAVDDEGESHHWPLDSLAIQQALRSIVTKKAKVLVRSSGLAEDFEARGCYESQVSDPTVDGIKEAASRVWRQADAVGGQIAGESSASMALIVQKAIKVVRIGHLSNERRISHDPKDWLIEEEIPHAEDPLQTSRMKVKASDSSASKRTLHAKDQNQLRIRLRELARWASNHEQRMHFEWVWDGSRLWIVQCDVELHVDGTVPGQTWNKPLIPPQIGKLRVMVEAGSAKGNWQKIEAIRTLRACGVKTAKVFVLEDARAQRDLIRGKVSRDLRRDLALLFELAVVIRSEVKAAEDEFPALSPRTATLSDVESALAFLTEQSQKFSSDGVKAGDFCYLLHHFIPARSGAFSFSKPGNPRVRIDST